MNTEIAVPETDGNLGPGLEQAQTYGHTIYAIYNIDIFSIQLKRLSQLWWQRKTITEVGSVNIH